MKATSRNATTLSRSGIARSQRRAVAARDASLPAAGSGAPSRARTFALALLAALLLVALTAASASASKQVYTYVGGAGSGSKGAEFNFGNEAFGGLGGVAVNAGGAGPANPGDYYVVDRANNRVQRFDKNQSFISAWGANVTHRSEVQTVTVTAEGGTFTLTFGAQATVPIAFNASASTVQTALRNLSSIVSPNVTVGGNNGGPYTVTFVGTFEGTNVEQLTANAAGLEGFGSGVKVKTVEDGSGGAGAEYEVCITAALCGQGVASPGNGATSGDGSLSGPAAVAVDEDTGNVYVADIGNRRIDEYDGAGAFIRSFGFAVDTTTAGTGYEVCPATDVCAIGSSGAGAGQFSSSSEPGVAVSPPDGSAATGKLFAVDNSNNRFNTYNLDGTSPASISASGKGLVGQVAVDSRGILYLSSRPGGGQIARYDSQGADGPVGFLEPIHTQIGGGEKNPGGTCKVGPILYNATFNNCNEESSRATKGLAVDPDSDGAGPDKDVLYVLREVHIPPLPENGESGETRDTVIQQLGPLNAPGLTTPPVANDDVHGSAAGLQTVNSGVGIDTANNRLLLSSSRKAGGGTVPEGNRVYVLAEGKVLPDPAATMSAIATHTDTTATFAGTVDPKGGIGVACKFQYSTDQVEWTDVTPAVPGCPALAAGGGAQAVSQAATGLEPNTHYYVRLAVTRTLSGLPYVSSSNLAAFDTSPALPAVTELAPLQIGDTSVRFVATIDPQHSPTAYSFQYGTTPALGSATSPVDIGAGSAPQIVSDVVGGLTPDTTYYLKLVATNLTGATATPSISIHTRANPLPPESSSNCGNQELREEQNATFLPDCRAYEQVTPPDKNLGDASQGFYPGNGNPTMGVSIDGDGAAYCTTTLFGEPAGQQTGLCAPYVSRRTAAGWRTATLVPPYCSFDGSAGNIIPDAHVFLTPDFAHAVIQYPDSSDCAVAGPDPNAPPDSFNLYSADLSADPATYGVINAAGGSGVGAGPSGAGYGVVSDDGGHVAYDSRVNQTAPPDSPAPGNFTKVYDWEAQGHGACTAASIGYDAAVGGCLDLVSKDTAGVPFTTESIIPTYVAYAGRWTHPSAISTDGSHIFFQNEATLNVETLYLRVDDAETVQVSASECNPAPSCAGSGNFEWAIPSGEVAFFSAGKRTDDSAGGLYRWQENAPPSHHLTPITVDHEPSDSGGSFKGLLGVSEDGDTAYFVSTSQLVAGAPLGGPSEKIYRWRYNGGAPALDYIGASSNAEDSYDNVHRHVTPSGEDLLIRTRTPLTPIIDRDSAMDLYRWDEADRWLCISCQFPGVPSSSDVDEEDSILTPFVELTSYKPLIPMSDDGKRIFFDTKDALLPADVNGQRDVYEWNDGTLSLISSGVDPERSTLIDSDPSGDDVFFLTRNRLVGWDLDENLDLYDARAEGGFPEPPPTGAVCEGEACREEGSHPGNNPGAGTAVFSGSPNQPKDLTKCGKGFVRRDGKCVRRHKKPHHKRHHRRTNHNRRAGR